jgi:hypothetical protein
MKIGGAQLAYGLAHFHGKSFWYPLTLHAEIRKTALLQLNNGKNSIAALLSLSDKASTLQYFCTSRASSEFSPFRQNRGDREEYLFD